MNITAAVQRLESSDTCSIIITHTHGGMSTVKSDHARNLLVYLWLNYSNILHIHGGPALSHGALSSSSNSVLARHTKCAIQSRSGS